MKNIYVSSQKINYLSKYVLRSNLILIKYLVVFPKTKNYYQTKD